nr:hypothetical protein [candidate division Zixibacteria bacterium]
MFGIRKTGGRLGLLVILSLLICFSAAALDDLCGDINGNGQIDILDGTYLIIYLYRGGPAPPNPLMADLDGSGNINILDVTFLINWLYKGGPGPNCGDLDHQDIRGECLRYDPPPDSADYMVTEVIGNDLYIYHFNAYYNCCLAYVVDYEIEDYNITAVESDTGAPCDCICYFDLKTILYDLDDGEYVVRLIGIEGDTVGVDTVTVNGQMGVVGYDGGFCYDSGLQEKLSSIIYVYSGGILTMQHLQAWFNCVANIIMKFEIAGDTLRFYEINISREAVWCMCYYDLSVMVNGIPPGTYVAEVYEQQYYWEDFQLVDRRELFLE